MAIDRLTAEQLAELARLEKAATQGPWVPCIGSGNCECTGLHSDAADGVICDFLPDYELDRYEKKVIIHNMRFVAAFRNAAPALLADAAELARLRAQLAEADALIVSEHKASGVELLEAGRQRQRADAAESALAASEARAEKAEAQIVWAQQDMARMQSAANGLVEACRKHLAPHFPPDTRDLDWDVFPGAVAQVCQRLAASESKRKLLAAECKAGRLWNDRCRCGGECECIPGKKLHKARVATDAACALEGE